MIYQLNNVSGKSAGMTPLNSSEPTFIIKMESKKICEANGAAISGFKNQSPIGKELSEVVYIQKQAGQNITPAYFNEEWFSLKQETFLGEGSAHIKVRLEHREGIPDFDVMQSLKKMIGFLLHRVRSPLTGIQGYTELIEDNPDIKGAEKYLNKINSGVDELFELLDELDTLQEISLNRVELKKFSANPREIIHKIIATYPDEIQNNITYKEPDSVIPLQCNPGDMRRILSLLIDNAVEHAPAEEHNITISQPSPNSIKIAHDGNPIPKAISEQLFYPFVTTGARKLGIGLTMAMLYAQRYSGSIFVTDNNPFRESSFLFCLPPTNRFQTNSFL